MTDAMDLGTETPPQGDPTPAPEDPAEEPQAMTDQAAFWALIFFALFLNAWYFIERARTTAGPPPGHPVDASGLPVPVQPTSADQHEKAMEYFRKGSELFRRGDFENAAAAFRESLAHHPRHLDALEDLAICYAELRNHEAQLEVLEQIAALGGDVARVRRTLSAIRLRTTSESLPTSSSTSATLPTTQALAQAETFFRKAARAFENGRFVEAVGFYESALRLNPDHADARMDLFLCHIQLGQLNLAEGQLIELRARGQASDELESQLKRAKAAAEGHPQPEEPPPETGGTEAPGSEGTGG